MKKLVLFFVLLIVVVTAFIGGKLLFESEEDIPSLKTESMEFGKVLYNNDDTAVYIVDTQKLESQYDFIDQKVNSYVDEIASKILDKDYTKDNDKIKEKEVLVQKIDTYNVNEDIISVKVTSKIKLENESEYKTEVKTFNYTKSQKQEISLDEIFKAGYKDVIGQRYTDNYLLKSTQISFYNGSQENICTYKELKDYMASKILTADNFLISKEEYDSLASKIVDKNKKMVAITFDDGPHATNTQKILDILKNYNARATFFMVGQNVNLYPDVVKAVSDSGNEIGIHTWNHANLTTLSKEKILEQVNTTSDAIYNITGKRPKLVRPPYGSINSTVKSTIDMPLILWNIDSLDWKSRDEKQIVPLVLNDVQDRDIILLHDIHSTTIPAAEKIIKSLTEQGYQLVTVSELLQVNGYDLENVKVFYSGRQ